MDYFECLRDFQGVNVETMRPEGFLNRSEEGSQKKCTQVSEGSGWKEVPKCPVCRSEKRKLEFTKFDIDILRCEDCTLRYVSKVPADTKDIYSDASYVDSLYQGYMTNYEYRKKRFGEERIRLIQKFVSPGSSKRLLDLGCGTGWFLDCVREAGFEVHGQELGKHVAARTAERLGISLYSCPVSEIPPSEPFDVITLFDLIEHVPDPLDLLYSAKRLLKPGGILMVLTPNFDSLAIRVMKELSNLIAPCEHLTYFTPKSVKVVIEQAGLDLLYLKTRGIDMADLKSYFEYRGALGTAKVCQAFYNVVQPFIDSANRGNHLRFIAQLKVSSKE